jgi:hypothetical protein
VKLSLLAVSSMVVWAAVTGSIRGVVHDPDHRPMQGAMILVKSVSSDYSQTVTTSADGSFEVTSVPVGAYQVTVSRDGFASAAENIVVASGASPVLHFQLMLNTVPETVNVQEQALTVSPEQMTRPPSSAAARFR